MSSFLYIPGSFLPSLMLTLLLGLSGTRGQKVFQVLQPKNLVSVAKGETVILNCTVTRNGPAGPVQWFKEKGSQRKNIYNFKGNNYDRIKQVATPSVSHVDFSISISNVTPEDTGTYYCVKFQKGTPDIEFKSGGGTMLSVFAKPSSPLVYGPQERINVKKKANFSCNSYGFSPKEITLKWFKNGNEIFTSWTKIFPEGDSVSYNISSILEVFLEPSDVHSQIICEVWHKTLQSPLRGKKNLSDIIRVLPEVDISSQFLDMNHNITCHVIKFYPSVINVSLLVNGSEVKKVGSHEAKRNKDGTYSLNISLLYCTCLHKEFWITCQVWPDSQPSIITTKTVFFSGNMDKKESGSRVSGQVFLTFLLGLKMLLLFSFSIFFVHRRWKTAASGANFSFRISSAQTP